MSDIHRYWAYAAVLKRGVVSGRVEKATTTWEKVDLSG